MKIGPYSIKPIALYLSDEERWVKQYEAARCYFAQSGVEDIHWLNGCHAVKWGIKGTKPFLLDGRPEENFYIGDGNVGNFISQYIAYCVMQAMDHSHFMYLEGDCEFHPGWREKLAVALEDIPSDFDVLYVGSCCCDGKRPTLVNARSNLYKFDGKGGRYHNYPLCTHCYIIAKKAVPVMIETQRDASNPTDISIAHFALPRLQVYAILPRLASQFNTVIPP